MNDIWKRRWEMLQPYQRKLLSVALRWLICGNDKITTTLIADEVEKKYGFYIGKDNRRRETEQPDQAPQVNEAIKDDEQAKEAETKLPERPSIKALRDFARDFLEFYGSDEIRLSEPREIRDWVIDEDNKSYRIHEQTCTECRERMQSFSINEFAPKQGSLLLALRVMQTLNDWNFQKDHIFQQDTDSEEFRFFDQDIMYPDDNATTEDPEKNSPEDPLDVRQSEDQATARKDTAEQNSNEDQECSEVAIQTSSETGAVEHLGEPDDIDTISLSDADDDSETANGESDAPHDNVEDGYEPPRYEHIHWIHHIRMAEEQWKPEERSLSAEWGELYALAEKFMDGQSPAFRAWIKQTNLFVEPVKRFDVRVHLAAGFGAIGLMNKFVEAGDSMSTSREGTPLSWACTGNGNWTGLEEIIAKSTSIINDQDQWGQTPLFRLIRGEAPLELIQLLIGQYQAKIDVADCDDWFPLHLAVRNKDVELCKYMLDREDCSPNVRDSDGELPLHWLLKQQDAPLEIAALLIAKGAHIGAKDGESQQPLYEAACSGNIAVAKVLLEHKADIDDVEDTKGWTALHKAVSQGDVDFVKMTPLYLAAKYGYRTIIEAILDVSAENEAEPSQEHAHDERKPMEEPVPLDEQDQRQESSMASATSGLLKIRDICGRSPVHVAAAIGHVECVELILKAGNPTELCSSVDNFGATPLHLAAKSILGLNRDDDVERFQRFTRRLLRLKNAAGSCSPSNSQDMVDSIQTTEQLQECIRNCMKLLLENNADPNALDHNGDSPLHSAVCSKDIASVQLLLRAGADPMRKICFESETTIVQKVIESWRNQEWEDDSENLVEELLRSSQKLSSETCLNILSIALERGATQVLNGYTARLAGNDQHGWSLLALAVQFREGCLVELISLPRPEHYSPRWSDKDKHSLMVVSGDGNEVTCSLPEEYTLGVDERCAVRSDLPIPPGMDCYYYEIEIVESGTGSEVGLGFASQFFPLHNMPGWFSPYMSWGYHGDDGDMYGNKAEIRGGHTYGKGDIVGAGVDFSKQEVFFTRNGESLGTSFQGKEVKGKLFPIVGMFPCGIKIRANFGEREFKYPLGQEREPTLSPTPLLSDDALAT
ncbi:hypothetical protein HDK90DRAFT_24447 [Phyllosticta capitalensis]|uniref:B30.2/SPRY domain-containing protein n=1 Tax=Phyllosticta capitalensis TaxID=121624 RepID=A0ABR1Z3D1_9PEZI